MEYTYFTFDGIPSSKYNLYIQNNGEDLSYPSQPNFENQLVSPLYQGTNFLAGVNETARVFNFNCWVDSITRKQMIDLKRWLSVKRVGKLILDYNPNFYYNVKLNQISDFKHLAFNEDETANYEFQISFITVEDFSAISNITYSSAATSEVNADGFERGFTNNNASTKDIFFYNFYNSPFPLNLTFTNLTNFIISKNDTVHYDYAGLPAANYFIDTKYGFCINSTPVLAESLSPTTAINLGSMMIDSNISFFSGVISGTSVVGFTPQANIRYINIETQVVYSSLSALITSTGLLNGEVIEFKYLYPTKITIPLTGATFTYNYRDSF